MTKEIMSQEAFNEVIDNLEIVETLTDYGKEGIKYNVKKLQDELSNLREIEKKHQEENGKLRVELEQEKEKNKKLYEQNQIYVLDGSKVNLERHIKNNYIRKDKIQEKIREYDGLKIIDKQAYEEQIKPLKELWEDNNG